MTRDHFKRGWVLPELAMKEQIWAPLMLCLYRKGSLSFSACNFSAPESCKRSYGKCVVLRAVPLEHVFPCIQCCSLWTKMERPFGRRVKT